MLEGYSEEKKGGGCIQIERICTPLHPHKHENKHERNTIMYIMTSIETDVEFVDNASDTHMSDEEREYWIDLEESHEEEEEMEIEPCDDIAFDNAFNSVFGISIEESRKIRKAKKKALVRSVPNLPTSKYFVNVQEGYAERLSRKFNHQGVK